ncbi:MAG: lipid-binding SYLF domain-containing protein [Thioalkalivibrionaceae bacterium]
MAVVVLVVTMLVGTTAQAQWWTREVSPQQVIDDSLKVMRDMTRHPDYEALNDHLRDAQGVLIFPSVYRGGFFIGGSGGLGVLLGWSESRQDFSPVAFYSIGSVSLGLQFGGDRAEVAMVVRTRDALESMFGSSFQLGGDAGVAAGPVGAGRSANVTAEILTFARSRGAYIGLSLEGSQLRVRDDFNEAYYGRKVRPIDIVSVRAVDAPGTQALRDFLKSRRTATAISPSSSTQSSPAVGNGAQSGTGNERDQPDQPEVEPGSGGLTIEELEVEAL